MEITLFINWNLQILMWALFIYYTKRKYKNNLKCKKVIKNLIYTLDFEHLMELVAIYKGLHWWCLKAKPVGCKHK